MDLPAVSEKDKADLRFGVEQKVDMIFASFIRKAADVQGVRDALGAEGKNIMIIAKIEKPQAIDHLEEIVNAVNGIMVARGDLGVEMSPDKVPMLQKRIIELLNEVARVEMLLDSAQVIGINEENAEEFAQYCELLTTITLAKAKLTSLQK